MTTLSNAQVFDTLHTQLVQSLSGAATKLVPDGQDLAIVLLFITLSWILVTWMLTADGPSALYESVKVIARYSIVTLMLVGWISVVGGYFVGAANDLGTRLTGGATISQSINVLMRAASGLFSTTDAANMADCVGSAGGAMDPGVTATTVPDGCPNSASNSKSPGVWDLLNAFPMIFITYLLRLITVLALAFLGAVFLGVIFFADISFGIGMILGPILVPWLIWERMQFLFDGWLKFMIVATLQKVVAAVVLMVIALLINTLGDLSKAMNVSGIDKLAVDEFAAVLMVIVAWLGIYICWQAPALASALVSGGVGITPSSMAKTRREMTSTERS